MGGRLIALTTGIGSGKTVLSRQLRADLEREGRVIVSRSLSIDKVAALFDDLTPGEDGKISSQSEGRERDVQELFPARQEARGAVRRRRARPPPEDADRVEAPHRTGAEGGRQCHRTVSTPPAVMGLATISTGLERTRCWPICADQPAASPPLRRHPPTMPSLRPSQWPRRTQTNLPPGNSPRGPKPDQRLPSPESTTVSPRSANATRNLACRLWRA
jgi:hypothetical protein